MGKGYALSWENGMVPSHEKRMWCIVMGNGSDVFSWQIGQKKKTYGWQVCEEGLLELWPQPYHPRPQVFFLCHGFIKFMYINKILMKTRLQFLYITFYNVNYFVSQPVGLDFTSGSGFCQWVWMLPVGLDCQWVWIWKPHGPDSLLYHVIYTQPWHNE